MLKILRPCAFAAVTATVLAIAGSAHADVAPEEFRERMLDASAHCYAAYNYLAINGDGADLRQAAYGQAQGAMDLYNSYANVMDEGERHSYLWQAGNYLIDQGYTYDQYFDMAVYCDEALNDLIDEADYSGYVP